VHLQTLLPEKSIPMVQGLNFMKVDMICLKRRVDMSKNAINVRITSSTEIAMDSFDKQWNVYTRNSRFFSNYQINDNKKLDDLEGLEIWYRDTLKSQFENSSDGCDRLSLIHWTIEIGNREEFMFANCVVPFYAIIKTPDMDNWYTHANVKNNLQQPFIRQSSRLPLFDRHEVGL
ncbi:hypothetical protein Bhyg_07416, partial [Pseudolycoriella hygida]